MDEKNEELSTTEFDAFKVDCSKHNDVTNATVSLNFASKGPDGKVHQYHYLYCLACLNELLTEFQKAGKIGTVSITPIYKPGSTEISK